MTIAAGSNTAPGTYTITVTGSGGGVQHTTTVTLTVPQPDFTLTPSPSAVTVVRGNSGTSTLTTTVSGGFNSAITLSATGVPTGTTVSFSPDPIAGAGTSTMTIAVGSSTTIGIYPITVTGNGGTVQHTTTVTLTVATGALVSIAVTAPQLSIAQNTSVSFTATGTYADQSTQNITTSVTWTSSNPLIAAISNGQGTQGIASSFNTAGTTQITATLGSVTSPAVTLTVTAATLVSIAVTPANPQIVYQTQQQFTAIGTYSDSSTQDITNSVTWASSDTTKITITVSGLATGVNTTTSPVTISATQGSVTGSTTATVTQASVVSIAITPNNTTLAQTTSRQYTATATLANGSTLNVTAVANWTSSDTTIATVGLHTGLVTAKAVTNNHNPVNIQVTYNGANQTLPLDVTNATAQTVTVTPISATIPVGVAQRFNAVATFTDGTSQDISQNATWSTLPVGIANINSFGIATGVIPGTTTVTATFGTASGNAQLTVSTATLSSIVVTPSQTLLAPGSSINYQAVGRYSDGSSQFISNLVTWSSTDTNVVTITAGGVATGQSAGTANITATYQSITSNSAGVVVTASPLVSIAVTPPAPTVPAGVAQQFAAIGTFANATTQNLTTNVTWASSQPTVATISNAFGQQGIATGVSAGQTSITAVFASIVSNPAATLNVSNATLVSIAVTPNNFSTNTGTTVNYRAIGTFSDQSTVDLTTQVTWASSVPSVATISTVGLASTASPGTTVISAAFTQNGVTVNGMTNLTVH
jgi:hypothetical protein